MLFQIVSGFPCPVADEAFDGSSRAADGSKFFDLDQAASFFGVPAEQLERLHYAFYDDFRPPEILEARPIAEVNEDEVLRRKFSYLPDEYYDELRTSCRHRGIDLFTDQVLPRVEWDQGLKRRQLKIYLKIDGLRARAAASSDFAGYTMPHWCGADGTWRDSWTDPTTPPAGARIGVWRRGFAEPIFGVASWASYAVYISDSDGHRVLSDFWAKYQPEMLMKCATSLALRSAYPDRFGGIYSIEEMGGGARQPMMLVNRETGEVVSETKEPESDFRELRIVKDEYSYA